MLLVLAETKYREGERDASSFFILTLDGDESLALCTNHSTSVKTAPPHPLYRKLGGLQSWSRP